MALDEMKKYAEEQQDNFELRSEKIRNMIGEMPSFLVRWGTAVLCVITILLFVVFGCLEELFF